MELPNFSTAVRILARRLRFGRVRLWAYPSFQWFRAGARSLLLLLVRGYGMAFGEANQTKTQLALAAAVAFMPFQVGRTAAADRDGNLTSVAPTMFESQSREILAQADRLLEPNRAPASDERAPAVAAPLPARLVSRFVADETLRRLAKRAPARARRERIEIARAIVGEANLRKLDPLLVMAVIEHESRFDSRTVGRHGEIGLMQIKPSTAAWIGLRAGLAYRNRQQLFNPIENVRFGVAYLSMLRATFKASGLAYLSAYNLGPLAVRSKYKVGAKPRTYVAKIMNEYRALRLELREAAIAAGSFRAPTIRLARSE